MNIIINRSDAIGDLILTTPIAQLLKETYVDASITFIISSKCVDVVRNHPHIDDYYILEHEKGFFYRLKGLYELFCEKDPKIYIHVGGKHLPTFISWLKRITFRGGLRSKWQTFLFLNKGTRQKRSLVEMHEVDYNMLLLKALGINYDYSEKIRFAPVIHLEDGEVENCFENFLEDHPQLPAYEKLIVVHPGMTGHTLNWPSRNYGKIIRRINGLYPDKCLFLLSHTPSDMKYVDGVQSELGQDSGLSGRVILFNGALQGLRNYMGVLSKADLFIGPSTGTTHISNIMGVRTIGIYSPIKVQSAKRWGPFHQDSNINRTIVPSVVCGESFKCAGESCPY
jgi:ADP-heptose:LPS heptosyltransferase